MFPIGKQASHRGQLSHQPLQGISHRPARADEARENTWFFQAIPNPVKSASLQAARVLDVMTKQPRKEGGHLWVPLAVPGCPRPLPPAKDRVGDWRWLLPPPHSRHELQKQDSQDPPSALPGVPLEAQWPLHDRSVCSFPCPSLLFLADLLPALVRGGCVFFFMFILKAKVA